MKLKIQRRTEGALSEPCSGSEVTTGSGDLQHPRHLLHAVPGAQDGLHLQCSTRETDVRPVSGHRPWP